MNLVSLIQRVAGRQQQRKKSQISSYRDLVRDLAAGKEPALDEIERVLSDAGKSTDDLRQAVELRQKRLELRTKVDAVPALKAEIENLKKQCAQAKAIKDEAKRVYAEKTNPLYCRIEQARKAVNEAEALKSQLIETCPYEELRDEMAKVVQRHAEAGGQVGMIRRVIDESLGYARVMRSHVQASPESQGVLMSDKVKKTCRQQDEERIARAEAYEAKAKELQPKLAEAEKQLEDVKKRADELREQMQQV